MAKMSGNPILKGPELRGQVERRVPARAEEEEQRGREPGGQTSGQVCREPV